MEWMSLLIWGGGAIVGYMIAASLNLGGKEGPIAGVLQAIPHPSAWALDDEKGYIPWLGSLAIYGMLVAGGASAASKMKAPDGIGNIAGKFITGFGVGGFIYEVLKYPA